MWQSPMGLEKEKIMGVMIPGFGWTWHRNQNKLVLHRRSLFCPVISEVIEPRTVYILLSHFLRVTAVTSIFLWRWCIANDAVLGGNGTRQCNWNQRTWEGTMFSQFLKSLVWKFFVSGSMIVHLAEDSIWVLEKPISEAMMAVKELDAELTNSGSCWTTQIRILTPEFKMLLTKS